MPMAAVARLVDEHDTGLWRLLDRHVTEARRRRRDHRVRRAGLDETASRRGHEYITLFVDLDRSRLLFATPGRDAQTVQRFREDFAAHGGRPDQVAEACCDIAPPYLEGLAAAFPGVPVTLGRFHLEQLVNQAVDRTRRAERTERPDLRTGLAGHRYTFLRTTDTLSDAQLGYLAQLQRSHTLKTVRAFHLTLVFLEVFSPPRRAAAGYLRRSCRWAHDSGLTEMECVAATIRAHWDGALRWFTSHISNGVLEGSTA
jgi:transposase